MSGHPAWQSYFTVTRADDSAAQVKRLGGTVIQEPFDVFEEGRMAVVQDLTGAVFSVWEPKNAIGAQLFGEPGALAWNELHTQDTKAAIGFYAGLFGWEVNKGKGTYGDDYFEFHIDGRAAAGMMEIKKEWGEMPASWSIHFAVAGLDETMKKADGMGVRQIVPPTKVEGVGRFVFLQDPQGAHVAFIQIDQDRA